MLLMASQQRSPQRAAAVPPHNPHYYVELPLYDDLCRGSLAPDAEVMTPSNNFARVLSPSQSPSSYPSMEDYLESVAGKTVEINGTYVGLVGPSPNTYNYSGTFGSDGTITLSGTMSEVADPNSQSLTIHGSSLASAIYTNNGPYSVATATNNPQQVSNNDIYAAIYRDLVAGFDFGYVGGKYGENSANWYSTTPYNPPYACARKINDGYYNQYAVIIAANSDAYGFPFSDRLQPVQVALNNDVATLRITILPDDMLDAPKIEHTVITAHSIKLNWNSVPGATDYKVNVSPPLPAQSFDAHTAHSYTINHLNSGTPYTVSVTASNSTSTSEAIPEIVSTSGHTTPATGSVGWHFIAFFTGSFSGDQVTFNGETKPLPSGPNPSVSWDDPTGVPGQTNAYVFSWKHVSAANHVTHIYKSILYVTFASTPSTGLGSIDEAAADTFMAANQNLPTYGNTGFNLFLSVQPTVPRAPCVRPEPLQVLGGAHHPRHNPHDPH